MNHLAAQKGLQSFERVKELLDMLSVHQDLRAVLLQMQGATNSLHRTTLELISQQQLDSSGEIEEPKATRLACIH